MRLLERTQKDQRAGLAHPVRQRRSEQSRMTVATFLLFSTAWLPGAWSAQSHQEEPASAPAAAAGQSFQLTGIMNDRRISGELNAAAQALLEEGQAVPMERLIGQLDRTQCVLKLPRAPRWKVSSRKLTAKCQPGVLVLGHLYKCTNCPRHHIRTSTGFVLTRSGAFAAAYHAVNSPNDETIVAMTGDGRITPVTEVLAASRKSDLAILQLAGSDYTPLPLASSAPVGSTVRVISHPEQDYYMLTEGIVSRYFMDQRGSSTLTMMSITADFAKGSSGAPVFNERGAVIGVANNTRSIYYAHTDGQHDILQMVLKHCVPTQYLLDLIHAP